MTIVTSCQSQALLITSFAEWHLPTSEVLTSEKLDKLSKTKHLQFKQIQRKMRKISQNNNFDQQHSFGRVFASQILQQEILPLHFKHTFSI